MQKKIIVVKIGGSTLGNHDTTLEDLVELQKQGKSLVVVHGGAKVTSEWLARLSIPTSFVNGLRVTDAETLKVVAAALGGLINKELVVAIQALGGKAVGLSGCDGNLLWASVKSPEMGYVGEIVAVDSTLLKLLLKVGYMPVVAPISFGSVEGRVMLLNVNGDTAAGEIAAALAAEKLIFLTDVDGIHDGSKQVFHKLNLAEVKHMVASGVASGGMIPKIEASLRALTTTKVVRIIDGSVGHALRDDVARQSRQTKSGGTTIVSE
ncbi:MAG: acetylglutamate kinase [Dehalococcoidia bacterium]|nr:acetylglutamate kinase [Dehalococcoidia bacterium]